MAIASWCKGRSACGRIDFDVSVGEVVVSEDLGDDPDETFARLMDQAWYIGQEWVDEGEAPCVLPDNWWRGDPNYPVIVYRAAVSLSRGQN